MMLLVIKGFFEAVGAVFGYKEAKVEHLAESEIIDDKRDLEKACKCAEIALACAERYKFGFTKLDRASFIRNVRKFRRLK